MKRGNIPAYVMAIISVATSLGAYIFVTNASDSKEAIKEIREVNNAQDIDISAMKSDIKSILDSQKETRNDVKEILKVLK